MRELPLIRAAEQKPLSKALHSLVFMDTWTRIAMIPNSNAELLAKEALEIVMKN